MLGIPAVLLLLLALASLLWVYIVALWLQKGQMGRAKLLSFTVWITALLGCALTVARRAEIGGQASLMLTLGTFALLFIFFATTIAGGKKDAPNQWLMVVAVLIAAVEGLFLMVHGRGLSENVPEVLALAFLPGIVIQIRNSDASREHLLRLAAHVSTYVVWASVAMVFAAPTLAFGEGFSDQRRFPVMGLTMRLSGLTPHPNYLSVTALICLVLVLGLKMRWRLFTSVACLSALIMAESRNAIVTLVVVAGVAWVCKGESILGRIILITPLCLGAAVLSGWFEKKSSLTADLETNGRYRVWDLVIARFNEDPFNGWGPLAFQPESRSPLLRAGLQHAHNQFLQAIAEGGVLGGALIVVMLLLLLRIGVKHRYEVIYPSIVVVFMMSIFTEPFLTLHVYGLNYAVVPAFLMFVVMMSADARSEPIVKVVKEKQRRDLPDYFASPDAETVRLLGVTRPSGRS